MAQFWKYWRRRRASQGAAFVAWFCGASGASTAPIPIGARPHLADMFSMGRAAWIANLASLAWGSQVIVLLTTKILGVEVGAMTGFRAESG